MLDFKIVNVKLSPSTGQTHEPLLSGGTPPLDTEIQEFSESGTMYGREDVEFESNVNKIEVALRGFYFETENDHNIARLIIQPYVVRLGNIDNTRYRVVVKAAFRDNTPVDDFKEDKYIMNVHVLLILDRE